MLNQSLSNYCHKWGMRQLNGSCVCPENSYHWIRYNEENCGARFTVVMEVWTWLSLAVFAVVGCFSLIKLVKLWRRALAGEPSRGPSHFSLPLLPLSIVVIWLVISVIYGWAPVVLVLLSPFGLEQWRYFLLLAVLPVIALGALVVSIYSGWSANYFLQFAFPQQHSTSQRAIRAIDGAIWVFNSLVILFAVGCVVYGFVIDEADFINILFFKVAFLLLISVLLFSLYLLAFSRLGVALYFFWKVFYSDQKHPSRFATAMRLQWVFHLLITASELCAIVFFILFALLPADFIPTVLLGTTLTFGMLSAINLSAINDDASETAVYFPLRPLLLCISPGLLDSSEPARESTLQRFSSAAEPDASNSESYPLFKTDEGFGPDSSALW